MGFPIHVAIISLSKNVPFGEVAKVSAAIQKQVTRDFGPIWAVEATVDAFEQLKDAPSDYWVVFIVDHDKRLPAGAAGVHLDKNRQPFALVQADNGWELTTSHEVLEMLADPFGNRLVAGESPAEGQGRVEFLVEVCDPSEASDYGYTVNGILLSDFYTPQYFDPVAASSVRYSFTEAIKEPRDVLPGGYLSWHDPVSDEWFQWQNFDESKIVRLGKLTIKGSIRATIDEVTSVQSLASMRKKNSIITAANRSLGQSDSANDARARLLMGQVQSLMEGTQAEQQSGELSLRSKTASERDADTGRKQRVSKPR